MKSKLSKTRSALLAIAFVATGAFSLLLPATDAVGQEDYRKQRESMGIDVPPGDVYTGRSPFTFRKSAPAPTPKMAAPAPVSDNACAVAETDLVHMTKTMPAEVSLGEEFTYVLRVTAKDCIADVVVTERVPDGAEYISSEPAAKVDGKNLVWTLAEMDDRTYADLKVKVKAAKEGTLASCAKVHALPRVCAETFVGKATLTIVKSGPERALLGEDVMYNIVVSNTGTSVAKDVVVTDEIPAGLTHSSGNKKVSFNLGDLAPQQSRTIPVTLKASERGQHCNNAIAKGTNTGQVSDDACTLVVQPGLDIAKSGPKKMLLFKNATYKIVVTNTGDTDLMDVLVTDSAPAPTRVVSASDGGAINGNSIVWSLGTLKSKASKELSVVLTTATPGTHCNNVSVRTSGGLTKSAQACTLWEGLSALLIEVVDDPDPIQVGENTTYTIRVTNQGTAPDTNIKVVATFPDEVAPQSSDRGTIDGKTVTFPVFPKLDPKQSFQYTIVGKGAKVGDARIIVVRTSDDIPRPATEEESTRVF